MVASKEVELEKVHTNDNEYSDMMTKYLPREKLEVCRGIVRMAVSSMMLGVFKAPKTNDVV